MHTNKCLKSGENVDLFDKLVMLLGDCQVSLEEYAQLLDAAERTDPRAARG